MLYDYAPRLAAIAQARRRRRMFYTLGLLMLPAMSFQTVRATPDAPPANSVQLAQASP